MGQWSVRDFLEAHRGEWFTTKVLSRRLGISLTCVTTSCKKLRECGGVLFRLVENGHGCVSKYEYCHKSS